MGRQYNFFISPKQDLDFIKYLFESEYEIIVPRFYECNGDIKYDFTLNNLIIYEKYDDFITFHEQYHKLWIYKKCWGYLQKDEMSFFNELRSPVLEYFRCSIYTKNNFVSRGRLYISTQYKDEIDSYDIIRKEYQKLVRIIKKNIKYKSYNFEDGRRCLWPASQEIIDIMQKDYRIEN